METPLPLTRSAFTRAELMAFCSSAALLFILAATGAATSRGRSEATVCQGNLRQLTRAMILYSEENRGYVPHASWGTDLTGPDNWAYATQNKGRLPGLGAIAPSATGYLDNSPKVAVQHQFQHIGQLWPLVRDDRAFRCPADDIHTLQLRGWYLGRANKVTSYSMNPAVIGVQSTFASVGELGRTYKLEQFSGTAIAFWEADESSAFNFNDAASLPTDGASSRHSGGSHVGRFDGAAEFWYHSQFMRQAGRAIGGAPAPLPNRLWCNPGSTNGQ